MHLRHLIRNAVIFSGYFLSKVCKRHGGDRIIVFHDIEDEQMFKEKIEWIRTHYYIVPLERLLYEKAQSSSRVALTFDDGYSCWHEKVAPVLEELIIPATFFVCSGFVGLEGEEARRFVQLRLKRTRDLKPLTKSQLIDLARSPLFEIGSHTRSHIDLGATIGLSLLVTEILSDKEQLEDWISQPVRWFAYPFGMWVNISRQTRDYVKQVGFEAAFTMVPGFVYRECDRFMVSRDSLDINGSHLLWSAWLAGSYDSLFRIKESISRK